jgi:hypothetical protein
MSNYPEHDKLSELEKYRAIERSYADHRGTCEESAAVAMDMARVLIAAEQPPVLVAEAEVELERLRADAAEAREHALACAQLDSSDLAAKLLAALERRESEGQAARRRA